MSAWETAKDGGRILGRIGVGVGVLVSALTTAIPAALTAAAIMPFASALIMGGLTMGLIGMAAGGVIGGIFGAFSDRGKGPAKSFEISRTVNRTPSAEEGMAPEVTKSISFARSVNESRQAASQGRSV